MTTLSPTSVTGIPSGVSVLSTGDVRVDVFPDSLQRGAGRGDQAYQPAAGSHALRESIARYAAVSPHEVLIAPGARMAILSVLAANLGTRRKVLVPQPYWASYPTLIAAAGGEMVPAPGHLPDWEALLTPDVGAVVMNSPRNPDGSVLPADQLRELMDWANRHELLLLFDQIYRGVPMGQPTAPSVLDLVDVLPERCVVIDGLTKSHALAGLRLGWAIATPSILDKAAAHASHVVGGTSTVVQEVAMSVLAQADEIRDRMEPLLRDNLELILDMLGDLPGVDCPRPAGGIFVFPDIRGWLTASAPAAARANPVNWLLTEHRVAVVDGAVFGAPGHLRLSFALPRDQLETGLARLRSALGLGG